jgi:hypothetical protein
VAAVLTPPDAPTTPARGPLPPEAFPVPAALRRRP